MIKVNLLADRQAKDRMIIQSQMVMGVIVILASFVLCAFWYQVKAGQISDTNQKIAQAKKALAGQKKIRKKVTEMEAKEKRIKAMLKAIDDLMAIKRGPTVYYDNLNTILPPEIWVTSLTDNSGSFLVNGYSFSNNAIAQFMKNMEGSDYFSGVNLQTINKTRFGKETLKKFTINSRASLGKKAEKAKKKEGNTGSKPGRKS
ncbi:MAG TPA: hypothetical protein ENI77_07110 [Nitrospirae bacterium]|nr:hypothetical protein [Nitrospirota bacterium]